MTAGRFEDMEQVHPELNGPRPRTLAPNDTLFGSGTGANVFLPHIGQQAARRVSGGFARDQPIGLLEPPRRLRNSLDLHRSRSLLAHVIRLWHCATAPPLPRGVTRFVLHADVSLPGNPDHRDPSSRPHVPGVKAQRCSAVGCHRSLIPAMNLASRLRMHEERIGNDR